MMKLKSLVGGFVERITSVDFKEHVVKVKASSAIYLNVRSGISWDLGLFEKESGKALAYPAFEAEQRPKYNVHMDLRQTEAKTILSKCGIPGIDYVINPYTGCKFGCTYCYASFMGRFIKDKSVQDWGDYVFVKENAPELLKKELAAKFKKDKGKGIEIFLSSVTDPYQGVEAKYKITRQCLEIIADFGFEGYVSILTKSDLVTRDLDVFKKLKNVVVGMTVTSADDNISKYFETNAPDVSKRFEALETLNKEGIGTYAFIGPLLPHYVSFEGELEKVFKRLSEVGTKNIFVEHLNLSGYIRGRLIKEMKGAEPEIIDKFYESQSEDYREALTQIVEGFVEKYDMNLMTSGVIYHKEYQETARKSKKPWKHAHVNKKL